MIVLIRPRYYYYYFLEVIKIKALKERKWLDENILMLEKNPKEYYLEVFKEIVEEIKHNRKHHNNIETILI